MATVGNDYLIIEWPGMNTVFKIAKSEYRAMDRLEAFARKHKIKLEKKIKEGNMDLVDKYIGEGGPYRGMGVHGLAKHIKKKYGRKVTADIVMSLMPEEGLHPDDDYPDLLDALEAIGVKVK